MSNHFFSMGGYGQYIWTAYGITCFVIAFNFFGALIKRILAKQSLHL